MHKLENDGNGKALDIPIMQPTVNHSLINLGSSQTQMHEIREVSGNFCQKISRNLI